MHIFGEILFIEQQNDTQTADKPLKTTKNQQQQQKGEKRRRRETCLCCVSAACSVPFVP